MNNDDSNPLQWKMLMGMISDVGGHKAHCLSVQACVKPFQHN